MWQIQNPRKVFNYLHTTSSENSFELVAIIPQSKYDSFPRESREKIEKSNLTIKKVQVKDPNNPANLIDAVLITYIK